MKKHRRWSCSWRCWPAGGLAVASQVPEIQRYLKIRQM